MLCCQVPECGTTFQAWVEEMSAFVKALDPNHLVTIGEEGFFGDGTPEAASNPQVFPSYSFLSNICFVLFCLPGFSQAPKLQD